MKKLPIDIAVNVKGRDQIIVAFDAKSVIASAMVDRETISALVRTLEAALHEADQMPAPKLGIIH